MADNDLLIYAIGDVIMNRPDWEQRWDPVLPVLSQADIRYCNRLSPTVAVPMTPPACPGACRRSTRPHISTQASTSHP
jgi:hypothetical protein